MEVAVRCPENNNVPIGGRGRGETEQEHFRLAYRLTRYKKIVIIAKRENNHKVKACKCTSQRGVLMHKAISSVLHRMLFRPLRRTVCAGMLLCVGYPTYPAFAGQAPARQPTKKRVFETANMSLCKAMDAVCKRWHVTVVAEGGAPQDCVPNSSLRPLPTDTALTAISRIALAYDYYVTSHNGVFVLIKRYFGTGEVPDVTVEEVQDSLRRIVRLLAPFDTGPSSGGSDAGICDPLVPLLTPVQVEALSEGGLRISSLSAAQHDLARAFAFHMSNVPGPELYQKALDHISAAIAHDVEFSKRTRAGGTDIGYEFVPAPGLKQEFQVVGKPAGVEPHFVDDHTLPGGGALAGPHNTSPGTHLERLDALFMRLNARKDGPQQICTFDVQYAGKMITAAGISNQSNESIVASIAEMFDLRLTHLENGSLLLTHRDIPPAGTVDEIKTSLALCVPAPIRRAITASSEIAAPPVRFDRQISMESMRHSWEFEAAAESDLYWIAEAAITQSKLCRAPLSSLGTGAANDLSLVQSMGSFAIILVGLVCPASKVVYRLDDCVLHGRFAATGLRRLEQLSLSYSDPKTGSRGEIGAELASSLRAGN